MAIAGCRGFEAAEHRYKLVSFRERSANGYSDRSR